MQSHWEHIENLILAFASLAKLLVRSYLCPDQGVRTSSVKACRPTKHTLKAFLCCKDDKNQEGKLTNFLCLGGSYSWGPAHFYVALYVRPWGQQ